MDNSNLLTPQQMAARDSLASAVPNAPITPNSTPNAPQTAPNGLLTPAQMAQMASHQNPANPTGAVGSSWDAFDKAMAPTPTAPTTPTDFLHPLDALSNQYNGAIKTATEGVTSGVNTMNKGGAVNAVHGVAQAGLGAAAGTVGAVFSPFAASANAVVPNGSSPIGKFVSDTAKGAIVGGELGTIVPGAGTLAGTVAGGLFGGGLSVVNQIKDAIFAHTGISDPDKAMINNAINVGLAILGEKVGEAKTGSEGLNTPVSEIPGAIKTNVAEAGASVGGAADVATKASDIASAVKNKISPTPTIDQVVGQVAQGSASDVPSFTNGLQNIGDTSNIKTYSDLNSASTKTIAELAKQQDANLAQDTTLHPLSEFEQTTGTVKTNYVEQALQQLQDFYTKTNDAEGLATIKDLTAKANGEGLTVQDVNSIARMHGRDLSGFNPNTGELASGLSKQAAENTRVGLKNTVIDSIIDPTVRARFQALDGKMSDTFTVKDLSAKMEEKVNTLTQRLQRPNILQKIGGLVGKFGKLTGAGDLVQKLLGLSGTPGASTLSPVELEARLSSNLAKINAALAKNDAGFISDITNIIKSEPTYTVNQKPQVAAPAAPTGNADMGNYKTTIDPITGRVKVSTKPDTGVIELGPKTTIEPQAQSGTTSTINPKTGDIYVRDIKTGKVIKIIPKGKPQGR